MSYTSFAEHIQGFERGLGRKVRKGAYMPLKVEPEIKEELVALSKELNVSVAAILRAGAAQILEQHKQVKV